MKEFYIESNSAYALVFYWSDQHIIQMKLNLVSWFPQFMLLFRHEYLLYVYGTKHHCLDTNKARSSKPLIILLTRYLHWMRLIKCIVVVRNSTQRSYTKMERIGLLTTTSSEFKGISRKLGLSLHYMAIQIVM